MFRARSEIEKFLAVAEAGKIVAAAHRLGMTQPALTRAIARLESRFGAPLFERLPTGVRQTALGAVAAREARRLLRAWEEAEDRIGGALAGRTGLIRATADALWMQAVVADAAGRFREAFPGIELRLRSVGRGEGLRLLEAGESDLHCGGPEPLEQRQLLQAEIDKFAYLRDTISEWLENAHAYSERDWQKMIMKIILLIFPKYIAVLENVGVADFYSSPNRTKKRYIDLCLVDASGNIDVIEIKKPFDNAILGKTLYRNNSLPAKELSGSIMQAEKYLFHLLKWGVAGERALSKQYGARLPSAMPIRTTNPKAIIILGQDRLPGGQQPLSESQVRDLEVIKRKYANMMDILTYDDLLRRLNNIIDSLSQRSATIGAKQTSGTGSAKAAKG